jgi:DNA repair protein RAD16
MSLTARAQEDDVESPAVGIAGLSAARPRRSGLRKQTVPADEVAESDLSTYTTPVPVKRGLGRTRKTTTVNSASASSAPTPAEGSSESEYSTPATSKFPTPAASDLPGSSKMNKPKTTIEVQIPSSRQIGANRERALRNSKFSMSSLSRKTEILDSDDDFDELGDDSPDAKVAWRLQREENRRAMDLPLPFHPTPASKSADIPSLSVSSRPKRTRASTGSAGPPVRAAKKAKVIPDSDGSLDLDAEIAAGAEFDSDAGSLDLEVTQSDEELSAAPSEISDSDFDMGGEIHVNDEAQNEEDEEDEEDEEPLIASKASRSTKKGKAPVRKPTKRGRPSRGAATASTKVIGLGDEDFQSAEDAVEYASASAGPASTYASDNEDEQADESDGSIDNEVRRIAGTRRAYQRGSTRRGKKERSRLEANHPEITTMWKDLAAMPVLKAGKAPQPQTISRQLKPFQLEGLAWMKAMEQTQWKGGLLGDEMGLGKTIQAVSLIMSDYPAKQPSLVLVPPVALMQWQSEISSYTDGTLKTFVFHGTNQKTKGITVKELKKYDVIMMSYNSLESMYRKQEKGFTRKNGIHKEKSVIHSIHFHRIILDEAHSIKTRSTMTAKACFALNTDYRWCLSGTPLQNRIGEFFSLIRFLNIQPFACYLCKQCPCSTLEWAMDDDKRCSHCKHAGMQHVSVFNQELLNPIQKYGNKGLGQEAFKKLRLMTDRIMLRRLKKDHTNAMELPVKEVYVDRQFFGEEENDFANSIMTNGQRKFDTYVAQGVLLNNYANIFGLIMQMRQVADHPDLILKKHAEGGQNVVVCSICDEPAEDKIRSRCKHDFCRTCVASYIRSADEPDCPRCHIPLSIDLEQPEIEQDETMVKKSSIINRIKMENWTSSSKIELLVHELHRLRSDNAMHKSIIFSQFTTMLQLIEWRLRRAGITTVMLDGSMTPAQRQASIEHFMNNVDVECFLVSLKAGGVALNLTEASRVFIVDP